MKILSLETSGTVASAAVLDNNNILGEYSVNHKRTHSQKLMPMVSELLESLELEPAEIDLFSVSTGPGSFTGLRIGISTIKGMAHALDKPVVGIPTLDSLAYNLATFPGYICPLIDARNENVYTSLFSFGSDERNLIRHTDYMALHINDLIPQLPVKSPVAFLGDGAFKFQDLISKKLGKNAVFAPRHLALQRAGSVGIAAYIKALSEQLESYMSIVPFYLRVSQAERLYNKGMPQEVFCT